MTYGIGQIALLKIFVHHLLNSVELAYRTSIVLGFNIHETTPFTCVREGQENIRNFTRNCKKFSLFVRSYFLFIHAYMNVLYVCI